VLPSSVWSAHSADWGVKKEGEQDHTLNRHDLNDEEKAAQTVYKVRVTALMDQLATEMAPRVMDWHAIRDVVQDIKEPPSAYKARLYEQIDLHSGYDSMREAPKHFLNTMFVEGLCDEVRKKVKASIPGWKDSEPAALHERARQAWQTQKE